MNRIWSIAFILACGAAAGAADTYTIDPNHTHATFSFQHLGFSTFHGKIPAKSGTIVLDRERRTGTIDVAFDVAALTTAVPDFDAHLRSRDFFEVERYPTATFKSSRITFDGDAPAGATGDLTIKGISKPVVLKITSFNCGPHPMAKVPACGSNARATIKRSDYGMTYGGGAVKDEITLDIEVEAMQQAASSGGPIASPRSEGS